jgi:hypothetical protein
MDIEVGFWNRGFKVSVMVSPKSVSYKPSMFMLEGGRKRWLNKISSLSVL